MVEDIVVERLGGFVGGLVRVFSRVGAELSAVADIGRGDVAVEAVGVVLVGGVARGPYPVDEVERYAQLLVYEETALLELALRVLEIDRDVPGVHRGVADPLQVLHSSVFAHGDVVADVAGVGRVPLPEVVDLGDRRRVGGLLVLKHPLAPVSFVEQGEVEGRGYVLCGEEAQVVGFLVLAGEERPEICQFGVRGLGVVVRQGLRGVAP